LWFLGQARDLVRYLILARLLALALEPAVTWLHRR
jgi:predicted PurR-regulated permease PerM